MTATPGLGASRLASPALLRSVFRRHAAGVAVVTAQGGGRPVGFTATSLSSVSAEPPLISFGIGVGGSSWPVMSEADHVGVHILGEHQEALAGVFATSGADRFGAPTGWREGPEGVSRAGRSARLARLPCGAGARRGPPHRDRRGRVRRSLGSWPSSALSPGAVQRAARLNPPTVTQRCQGHSSKRLLSGHVLGVLTSNISFGAGVAPTGIGRFRRLCCLKEGSPEMTSSRRAGVSLRIVVTVKYVPDATGDRHFADDLTVAGTTWTVCSPSSTSTPSSRRCRSRRTPTTPRSPC